MKIFITGSTGNVGQAVLKELINNNHDVTCLVRKNCKIEGAKIVKGDLRKIKRLSKHLYEADAIIHLASPRSFNIKQVFNEDIMGMHNLLDNWKRGAFIYSSSQTVYGIPKSILTENVNVNPMCWYDLGKVINEFQIEMTEPSFQNAKAGISIRIPLLFGSSKRASDRQFLYEVYKAFINRATFIFESEEGYESYGSAYLGDNDCGKAFLHSLGIQKSGAYNISSGFCRWKDLLNILAQRTNLKLNIKIDKNTYQSGFFRLPQSRSYMNVSKFESQTDYKWEDNLNDVIDQFLKNFSLI